MNLREKTAISVQIQYCNTRLHSMWLQITRIGKLDSSGSICINRSSDGLTWDELAL